MNKDCDNYAEIVIIEVLIIELCELWTLRLWICVELEKYRFIDKIVLIWEKVKCDICDWTCGDSKLYFDKDILMLFWVDSLVLCEIDVRERPDYHKRLY